LDDWIYCASYIHTVRDYRQYSAIAIRHTFQFAVAHALGFSVFTSLILATGLLHYHCHFNSHMRSFWHSLIHFLPLFSTHISFLAPKLISCQAGFSKLDFPLSTTILFSPTPSRLLTVSFYNPSARTILKTACIVYEACLPRRCLAIDVLLLHAYASRSVYTESLPSSGYTRHNIVVFTQFGQVSEIKRGYFGKCVCDAGEAFRESVRDCTGTFCGIQSV
jgi:hypothetical protein